jgi:hypothetical protein
MGGFEQIERPPLDRDLSREENSVLAIERIGGAGRDRTGA